MGTMDTGMTCEFPGCDEAMFSAFSGRVIEGRRQRWLCEDHKDARWTPRGFVMPA